jgi:hypothetical protein
MTCLYASNKHAEQPFEIVNKSKLLVKAITSHIVLSADYGVSVMMYLSTSAENIINVINFMYGINCLLSLSKNWSIKIRLILMLNVDKRRCGVVIWRRNMTI